MTLSIPAKALVCVALATLPAVLFAQFTAPHVISIPGETVATLGSTLVVNQGLVGVGRISASARDGFGETFGSISGLQVTNWHRNEDGSYRGTFNIVPDRGYNAGSFFADYAARINTVGFRFTPYTGAAGIGGSAAAERLAAQNQIVFTTPITGLKFRYDDPLRGAHTLTTGLDPGGGVTTMFGGQQVPYVGIYSGPTTPVTDCAMTPADCPAREINRLPLDAEALVLEANGAGYIGDEYGADIYYFNPNKTIVGVIVPPQALQPHFPTPGVPYFGAIDTPVNGRRNNQGLEGVALSPDGTRLFALLQSGTIQDADGSQQNRRQTRLLVYDVSTDPTPAAPIAEYALTLPTFRLNGGGGAPTTLNRTAAQSEIVALDDTRILVLARDGNGLGNIDPNPSVYKSILLVDTGAGDPTNIAGDPARNIEAGTITTAPGILDPLITPLGSTEVVNILNSAQLKKFNIELDTSGLPSPATPSAYQVSKLTLGEKWEGMALVPANDPNHPNDYFLFVGNDDDFLTSNGVIRGPDGLVRYNGFNGYAGNRLPAPVDSPNNENDTVFLAYRVTIISAGHAPLSDPSAPVIVPDVSGRLGQGGWYTSAVTVTWKVTDAESGVRTLSNCDSTVLTRETKGKIVTCTATNGAGLSSSASVMIKIIRGRDSGLDMPACAPPTGWLFAGGSNRRDCERCACGRGK